MSVGWFTVSRLDCSLKPGTRSIIITTGRTIHISQPCQNTVSTWVTRSCKITLESWHMNRIVREATGIQLCPNINRQNGFPWAGYGRMNEEGNYENTTFSWSDLRPESPKQATFSLSLSSSYLPALCQKRTLSYWPGHHSISPSYGSDWPIPMVLSISYPYIKNLLPNSLQFSPDDGGSTSM
jgi:hypothetical protein